MTILFILMIVLFSYEDVFSYSWRYVPKKKGFSNLNDALFTRAFTQR